MIIIRKLLKLILNIIFICAAVVIIDYLLMKNHFITINLDHPNFPDWLKFLNS